MAKYERQNVQAIKLVALKRRFERASVCVRQRHIQVLDRSALKGGGSHFVSCQHDERLPNSLINDRGEMWKPWLLSLRPGCRLLKPQQLVTPPPGHPALLRIRSFCEMSESLLLPWSAGLATSVWTPRCSPLAVSSESLAVLQEISSSSHNTPGGRLLRQGAGSVSPPLDVSKHFRQIWTSSTTPLFFDAQFITSVVIREKPCVSFPGLRPRRTGCEIFRVYEGIIGGKQWGGGVT